MSRMSTVRPLLSTPQKDWLAPASDGDYDRADFYNGLYIYRRLSQDEAVVITQFGRVQGLATPLDRQSESPTPRFKGKSLKNLLASVINEYERSKYHDPDVEHPQKGVDVQPPEVAIERRGIDPADIEAALLDPLGSFRELRTKILAAEDVQFSAEARGFVAENLLRLALEGRQSSSPDDSVVVWSAIRTGASMITLDRCELLVPLLSPDSSIDTVRVTVKMIGRMFFAQPPESVGAFENLAIPLRDIVESTANPFAISSSDIAALSSLAMFACFAIADSDSHQIARRARSLGIRWFASRLARKTRELESAWRTRPDPVSAPVLAVVAKAIQSLER